MREKASRRSPRRPKAPKRDRITKAFYAQQVREASVRINELMGEVSRHVARLDAARQRETALAAKVRRPDQLNFGEALAILKSGGSVQRTGWNGKGLWLTLQRPDAQSKMTLPYIFMSYPIDAESTPGARVPWLPSQTDVLADDWQAVTVYDGVDRTKNGAFVSTVEANG